MANGKLKYVSEETDWISKEKRELFGKAVNSILMTWKPDNNDWNWDYIIAKAKLIVDRAFEFYPDKQEQVIDVEQPL